MKNVEILFDNSKYLMFKYYLYYIKHISHVCVWGNKKEEKNNIYYHQNFEKYEICMRHDCFDKLNRVQ